MNIIVKNLKLAENLGHTQRKLKNSLGKSRKTAKPSKNIMNFCQICGRLKKKPATTR